MKHLVCILLTMVCGCAGLPRAAAPSGQNVEGVSHFRVVNHGWHTGVIVPARWLFDAQPDLAIRFADAAYLEVGWGDADFYQADRIGPGLVLGALFAPSESVVHVVGIERDPEAFFVGREVGKVTIANRNIPALVSFLSGSFVTDADGRPLALGRGIYGDSQFYAGVGNYHLFNNCNHWTARALHSAGLDIRPAFNPTAADIMEEIAEHQPPP